MPKIAAEDIPEVRRVLRRKMAITGSKPSVPYEDIRVGDLAELEQEALEGREKEANLNYLRSMPKPYQDLSGSEVTNEQLGEAARRNLRIQQELMDAKTAKSFEDTIPWELQSLPGLAPAKIEDVVKVPEDMGVDTEESIPFWRAVKEELRKRRK